MKKFIQLIILSFSFVVSMQASAILITPVSVSGAGGTFFGSPDLLKDGFIPAEFSNWRNSTNVFWNGTTPIFTFNLGSLYNLDDVLLSVDNNDAYAIEWSTNSILWTNLFTIDTSDGEVWNGMDTMSTVFGNSEYVSGIDFSSVQAQYLRISAIRGDNSYSIGELQAFGSKVPSNGTIPEPTTLALMGLGLAGIGYRRKSA